MCQNSLRGENFYHSITVNWLVSLQFWQMKMVTHLTHSDGRVSLDVDFLAVGGQIMLSMLSYLGGRDILMAQKWWRTTCQSLNSLESIEKMLRSGLCRGWVSKLLGLYAHGFSCCTLAHGHPIQQTSRPEDWSGRGRKRGSFSQWARSMTGSRIQGPGSQHDWVQDPGSRLAAWLGPGSRIQARSMTRAWTQGPLILSRALKPLTCPTIPIIYYYFVQVISCGLATRCLLRAYSHRSVVLTISNWCYHYTFFSHQTLPAVAKCIVVAKFILSCHMSHVVLVSQNAVQCIELDCYVLCWFHRLWKLSTAIPR